MVSVRLRDIPHFRPSATSKPQSLACHNIRKSAGRKSANVELAAALHLRVGTMRALIKYLPVHRQPFWRGQAIALAIVAVALATRASVDPFIVGGLIFTFLFPGIFVAGLFGGTWSAITTALLGGFMMAYIWIPPKLSIALTAEGIFRMVLFWALAAMIIFLTSFVHVVLDQLATTEARAKTVASEMKHRVQNSLALVQAIVRQTLRNSTDVAEAQKLLSERLAALARAHDLIEDHLTGKDIGVENLVCRALEPFDMQQFAITGSSSLIVPQDYALSLMLLIHELATNAVKYGALSNSAGRVEISWVEEPAKHKVVLNWKERFGPPVDHPSRVGFGSRLLRAAFAREGADASIRFEPDGVRCTVAFSTEAQPNIENSTVQAVEQATAPAA